MKDKDLKNLYQQIILDHNRHPRHCEITPDANLQQRGVNPSCGDDYILYIKTKKDTIEKISFTGTGCALSKASASILTDVLEGKSVVTGKKQAETFISYFTTNKKSGLDKNLAVFEGVKKYPARVKCATLIWHTFLEATKKVY